MNDEFREELAANLPVRNDDEPGSLREDIFDELTDHLLCAMKREQLREGQQIDQETIWQRVLHRFGSPRQVARQLWFGWMREKIMMQRFTLLLTCLVVVMCGVIVFMMNKSLQSAQQQQILLMEQIAALTKDRPSDPQRSQPTEWNRLKVRIVYAEDESPVANARVEFTGLGEQTKSIPSSELQTDEDGFVDFGLVLYGKYTISVKAPLQLETKNHHVSVHPGQDRLFELVVPREPMRKVKLTPKLVTPLPDNIEVEESRLWHLMVWMNVGFASKNLMNDSTEPWWQSRVQKSMPYPNQYVSAFVSTQRSLPLSELEQVEFKERFDGLIAEEDRAIHRFAAMRYLVPDGLEPQGSIEFPYGQFHPVHTEPYLEMKLTDGRTVLTQISDLAIPVLLASDFKNDSLNARGMKKLDQFLNNEISLTRFYDISPGFVSGGGYSMEADREPWAGEYGMEALESGYGSMAGMGEYGGESSYGEVSSQAMTLGTRWQLSQYWDPFAESSTMKSSRTRTNPSMGGYGSGYGGMGGAQGVNTLNILPEFMSTTPIKSSIRIETKKLKNIPLLRKIGTDQYPIAGAVWYPNDIETKQFRLIAQATDSEADESNEVTLLDEVQVIGINSSQYSNIEIDNQTPTHLLMSIELEELRKLHDSIEGYLEKKAQPIFRARAIEKNELQTDDTQ